MTKQLLLIIAAVAAVGGGGSFYGGMKYAQQRASSDRQQRLQQFGGSGAGFRNGGSGNITAGGFSSGEILSKDEKSMTIKLRDGGSKIIFYSDATEIGKFVSGSLGDLEVGKNISVNGAPNADGSITAQSIQLRPQMPAI